MNCKKYNVLLSSVGAPWLGSVKRRKLLFLTSVTKICLVVGVAVSALLAAGAVNSVRADEQPKNVVELQPFRTTETVSVARPGAPDAQVTLINLSPKSNQWYILQLRGFGKARVEEYHLENPYPHRQRLELDQQTPEKLVLSGGSEVQECVLWSGDGRSPLEVARKSRQVFAPLCNNNLYLRNPTKGHRTAIESVTEFLRDNMPGGEAVVGFVKDNFFKDAYLENTRTTKGGADQSAMATPDFPLAAQVEAPHEAKLIVPADLGIEVEKQTRGMRTGHWYSVKNNPGVFVSLIQPKAVASDILKNDTRRAKKLDSVEAGALAYLVAFDLDRFELGFTIGTEHPRVAWSRRTLDNMRIAGLPGPDGIGTIAPLVASGMLSPVKSARTVATFTGGFKRSHGAFKWGRLAQRNRGSHYGFIENGVVLSTLQPGLATLLVKGDGRVEMKSWTKEDNKDLGHIIHARQNGVPLVEWDETGRRTIPGALVTRWGAGNWSGSASEKLRTLRAGVALQEKEGKRFLLYGFFSTATPSAMARVFQAYGCSYGMHMDMNALEHTYLALYHKKGNHLLVQHLLQGMSVLDKSNKNSYIPRFLGYSDNRDFFYLMRRE